MSTIGQYASKEKDSTPSKWGEFDSVLEERSSISVSDAYVILLSIEPEATYESARSHLFHLRDSGKATILNEEGTGNEVFAIDL